MSLMVGIPNLLLHATCAQVQPAALLSVVQDCVAAGQLSNAQIEAVVYAFMRFNKKLQNGELNCLQ